MVDSLAKRYLPICVFEKKDPYMKKLSFILLLIPLMSLSCGSKNVESEQADIFVDPQVKIWLEENLDNPEAVLPVLISSDGKLAEKYPLRLVTENYYTGRVSISDLKDLMRDKKVKRITSGKKQIHQQNH